MIYRKMSGFVFVVLLSVLLIPSVESDEVIRSASELDYPPFSIVNGSGEADGFSVELLKKTLEKVGLEVTFYVDSWNEVKDDLSEGRIDVLPVVGRTPEREAIFDFSVPYLTQKGAVFMREGDILIHDLTDLKGKEVIVMKGDNAEEFVRRENIIDSENVITTESYEKAFKMLSEGKHDAVITQRLVGEQIIEDIAVANIIPVLDVDEFKQDFTFAVREGDTELLSKINDGLSQVIVDGTFDKVYNKWFGAKNIEDTEPKDYQVLVLHSYHKGYRWTDDLHEGISDVLHDDIDVTTEYMDTKRHDGEDYYQELFENYKNRYSGKDLDVIITSDDNAFNFIKRYHDELFPGVPVVFSGVNYFEPRDNRELDGFTGVSEKADVSTNLDLITRLHPEAEKIYLIHDLTTTGKKVQQQLLEVTRKYEDVEFVWINDITMQEIEDTLSGLDNSSIVYYTLFLKDSEGKFFEYDESIERISSSTSVPVYGTWDFSLGHGIVGGMLTSGYEQGFFAAKKVLKILDGRSVDTIPILMDSPNKFYFDNEILHKHGIDIDKLPKSSHFINTPKLDVTFASSLIKLKALEVADQIERYLEIHEHSTLDELKDDKEFNNIAKQTVGETGYTAIMDSDTGMIYLHPQNNVEGLDSHIYEDDLPEFWSIFNKTIGEDCQDAEGFYDWKDPDGQLRKKYMYLRCIRVPTEDGKNLFVAATAYLDDFDEASSEPSESQSLSKDMTIDLSKINIFILLVLIFGFCLYVFFLTSSSENKLPEENLWYRSFFSVSLLFQVVFFIDIFLHRLFQEHLLYIDRLLNILAMFLLFTFFFLIQTITKTGIKKSHLYMIYAFQFILTLLMAFTDLFIKDVVPRKNYVETVAGPLYFLLLFVSFFYLSLTLVPFFKGLKSSKKECFSKKYFFFTLIFSAMLILINGLYYFVLQYQRPYLLSLSLVIFNFVVWYALSKAGCFEIRWKGLTFVLFLFVILLVGGLLFNAFFTTSELTKQISDSYLQEQRALLDFKENQLHSYFLRLEDDLKFWSQKVELDRDESEKLSDYLTSMYEKNKKLVTTSTLINSSSHIEMIVPHDPDVVGVDMSGQQHMKDVRKLQEPIVSQPFHAVQGYSAVVLDYPIFKDGEYDGVLQYFIKLEEFFAPVADMAPQTIFFLVGENKEIIYSENRELIGRNITEVIPQRIFDEILRKQKDVNEVVFELDGMNKILLAKEHDMWGQDWLLLGLSDSAIISDDLSDKTSYIFFSNIILVLILVFFSFVVFHRFTKNLRVEVASKTKELKTLNRNLEKKVKERTKEVQKKSEELKKLNDNLEKEVNRKTRELRKKIKKDEKRREAMLHLLKDMKKINQEIKEKEKDAKKANKELKKLYKEKQQWSEDLEKQVDKRTKELKSANKRITKLLKAKTDFLNQVAHDLRTPLTPITLLLDNLLKQGKFDKKSKERLDIIKRNVHSLHYLVTDVLNLIRIDSGKTELKLENVKPGDLVRTFIKDNQPTFDKKNIKVSTSIPKNLPEIKIDKDKVREVMANIISNAIKYMDKKEKKLWFGVKKTKGYIQISIADNGPGVPKDKIPRLFEEFYKVGQYHGGQSTGLGLAICKRIVEQHKGKLWATSNKGEGLTTSFTIPIRSRHTSRDGVGKKGDEKHKD